MSTPQENAVPSTQPAAIPWYKTAVIRGILVAVFTQLLAGVARKFHMDIGALAAIGLDANTLTEITLDGIGAAAAAYALHGRVVKPLPAVTLTRAKADELNAAASPIDSGGGNVASPLSQPPEKKP
jgi:hypothetical protein